MPTKREQRKQRSEAERAAREHFQRAKKAQARMFFIVGVLVALGIAILYATRRGGDGRVWSAEHGHYHDRNGREIR